MKKLIILTVFLLAPPFLLAITEHPDGSVTFTSDEASAMRKNVKDVGEEMERLEGEVEKANKILSAMLKRIQELQERKCI